MGEVDFDAQTITFETRTPEIILHPATRRRVSMLGTDNRSMSKREGYSLSQSEYRLRLIHAETLFSANDNQNFVHYALVNVIVDQPLIYNKHFGNSVGLLSGVLRVGIADLGCTHKKYFRFCEHRHQCKKCLRRRGSDYSVQGSPPAILKD